MSKQDGYIGAILILLIAILGCITVVSFGNASNKYNRFFSDCQSQGGIVQKTRVEFFETRYECFIDGEQVTLKGWENE